MQNKKSAKLVTGIFLTVTALSNHTEANATTTDFIVNGNFSDPTHNQQTGWTETGFYSFYDYQYSEGNGVSVAPGTLSQNVLDVAGGTDTLSFKLSILPFGNFGTEKVIWNNNVIADVSSTIFTTFTYNVIATGHDTLTFQAFDNSPFGESAFITDVALVPAVPEPEPAAMLLIGVGLIGWISHRKAAMTV